MDTDSFKVHLKTEDIYVDNALDVETRFDTSNSDVHRLLPKSINKKVIGLMKDELGGRIIKEFTALISKKHTYLTDNDHVDKKANGTNKCLIKKGIKFQDYKDSLGN